MEKIGGRPNGRRKNPTPFLRRAGLYVAVAFELPGTILGGLLVGYFLDNYFDSSPWFLISMTAVAFVGAIARLLRWVEIFARQRNGNAGQQNDNAH